MAVAAWEGDWRQRIANRLKDLAYDGVLAFVASFPDEPWFVLVRRLGDDLAAVQLETAAVDEARKTGRLREFARDALVRGLRTSLNHGWLNSPHAEHRAVGAFVAWSIMLGEDLKPLAEGCWNALTDLKPPQGWLPEMKEDKLIEAAFDKGWPM